MPFKMSFTYARPWLTGNTISMDFSMLRSTLYMYAWKEDSADQSTKSISQVQLSFDPHVSFSLALFRQRSPIARSYAVERKSPRNVTNYLVGKLCEVKSTLVRKPPKRKAFLSNVNFGRLYLNFVKQRQARGLHPRIMPD